MDRQLQVNDEEDEDDVGGVGRVDGPSTMTTATIFSSTFTFDLNDNLPSLDDVKRLESLICFRANLNDIRELLSSSLASSSCATHKKKEVDIFNIMLNKDGGIVNCILNGWGYTPLIQAVSLGLVDVTRCLLTEYGADVTISDFHEQTPLHYGANPEIPSIELLQLLLDHGGYHHHPCRVNPKDNDGNTPLYFAWTVPVIRLLLQNGANVNIRNHLGETPLYHAVKKHSYEVVEELLYDPSRLRISEENDPKSVLNHEHYDYDRIHCMKADNGLTPYDMISHRCQELHPIFSILDSQQDRLIRTFDQYEQKQQQLKRYIIYSYLLLSCTRSNKVVVSSTTVVSSSKEVLVVGEGKIFEEDSFIFKKQKINK